MPFVSGNRVRAFRLLLRLSRCRCRSRCVFWSSLL